MFLEFFTHVLEALRIKGSLLVHEFHLHSLLLVQLLHVLSEVLWAYHALGVVSGHHGVPLVHQGIVIIRSFESTAATLTHRAHFRSRISSLEAFLRVSALRDVVVGVLELWKVLPLLHDLLVDCVYALADEAARMIHILPHKIILAHLVVNRFLQLTSEFYNIIIELIIFRFKFD